MKLFNKSLILNIGAVILLVEFLVLTSLGLFYTERFSAELDRFLEDNIRLPGELMNRQLLRYESVGDHEVMTELVGEEFLDGMVVGADGRVYYAYDPELVGKSVFDVPNVNPTLLSDSTTTHLLLRDPDGDAIVSITPLMAYEGAKPFFQVYIKAGTQAVQASKLRIAVLFILGSSICIFLTSLAIIWYTQRNVAKPLRDLQGSADALRRGELDIEISTDREDEIGSLAASFTAMQEAIKQKIGELETANLNLEEREGRLQALIEAFPDRFILLDWAGRFLEIYAANNENVFLDTSDMSGNLIHEVHNKNLADKALDVIRRTITTGESQEMEYYLKGPEGKIWFESRTARVGDKDGEDGKVIWVARDITYRKEMERRLTRAKEDAESISMRLRELDQTKSALVSSVSHELRTPLTSLLGFSKLILKNFSKHYWPLAKGNHTLLTKGAQIVENLNILILEGKRLTRLINDVLDLNKIEMGHTEWREDRINPADLAHKATRAVSGQFDSNPELALVTRIGDDLPDIVVDMDRMLQVLLNLLTNSAKFTPAGMVILQVTAPATGLVRFEVSDTGPGIPAHEQERVFDVFHQAGGSGPADDKPRGAGLGLAICRDIIKHYNGTIWVESEPGQGATFIFELPVG